MRGSFEAKINDYPYNGIYGNEYCGEYTEYLEVEGYPSVEQIADRVRCVQSCKMYADRFV